MKKYTRSLFIFRRDLRLEDNTGLIQALAESEEVVPLFIFDPEQIDQKKNAYFSRHSFQFMVRSLVELDAELQKKGSRLFVLKGAPEDVVKKVLQETEANAVYLHKDYTPFSRKRDKKIQEVCEAASIDFYRIDDYTLAHVEEVKTGEGKVYTVYTPFMKKASSYPVHQPVANTETNYFKSVLTDTLSLEEFDTQQKDPFLFGGRAEALRVLHDPFYLSDYKDKRNIPALHHTSRLSAHHKFGTVSIRETYHAIKRAKNHDPHFISELYWRDFYYYIAYHFPQVFKESFLPWANNIQWINDEKQFTAWKEGKTGVPMVDAGMRELLHTGWVHNRSRMIVASYLTKNLLIDWRWGEQHFAQNLIDYDPAQNNGGWQWSASVGADPRPLRIFNPYTQAQKYDPEAEYIKRWIPELASVEDKLLTDGKQRDFSQLASYPPPLVDQTDSYHRAMDAYKKAKASQRK